uniref:Small subunit processome component 20 homolog n=1 Tax=Panagrolaimus superbus TaxID=310955 RepID=A0A914Z7Q9_9BILA
MTKRKGKHFACQFLIIFEFFKKQIFTNVEIECLWKCVIEPIILQHQKSTVEHFIPASLSRFVTSLTKLPMFYPLLIKPFSKASKAETPLSLNLSFLNSKECTALYRNQIVNGIFTLLSLRDEPSAVPELAESKFAVRDEINMGTELILTQLPKIIQFLVANIPTDLSKAKNLPLIYLDILNRLSEFVEDSEVGEHFASTLLSYIENDRIKNEEKITAVLQTISSLVGFVKEPKSYLRRIPRLITSINYRASREALISIVSALSKHSKLSAEKSFIENLKILEDLEAWDKKKLNEPDQERRHQALADLDRLYSFANIKLDPINIVLFVRSHASTVSLVDDIALRSAASSAFSALISYTSKIYADNVPVKQDLLRKHFIPLIANGIRSNNEAIRNEFILAFDILITSFSDCDKQLLIPFKQLQHDDKDLDFFANVTHIQHHRRQRAFKRLVAAMEEKTITLPFDSLMKFILPMVHPYFLLTEPKYAQLVAESLNVLREIMKHASWTKYYRMLSTYIHQLTTVEQTKPYVRVIVAIVDAFHFDLQHCDFKPTEFQMAKNPKRDKRKLGSALRRKNFEEKKVVNEIEKVLGEESNDDEEEMDEKLKDEKEKAKKILEAVLQNVLPKLQDTIKPNHKLLGHKKSHVGKYFTEDEDLKRVPLALATVKLLQKLPEWVLNRHLHNVVVTLITLLLSRSSEVRQSARKTMQQVIQGLGVKHLSFFIKEMKQTLTRGFQVHVMIYTIHFMIQSMEAQLKTGDLDACMDVIVDVCKQEQFSDTTEEKELSTAVSEAKANKTGETYQFLGKFVSYASLMKVVNPMKEIFESKPNAATMKKLSGLLRSFVHGLRSNEGIPPEQLLTFTQKILDSNLSEMTKQLAASQPAIQAEEDRKKMGFRPESCYILPAAPKRLGAIVKTSIKAQASIFVEFGVNLLANLLKVHAFDPKKPEDAKKLDPFLPMIIGCLKTKYEKIIGVSLRCLHGLLKFPLPSVEANKNEIIERLFVILADYAGLGAAGHLGSIQELSQNLFKCFNQMIHIAQATILTPKRLQILLNYCETDILDSQKQATAFALIKSILGKRIKDDKITTMMDYLAELSITSTIPIVRTNCREIIIQYITNYRIVEEDAEKWLSFYLEQLEYEFEDGRLSTLEMINSIINAFTEEVNNKFALLVFIKLSARFVNDESKKCVKFVQLAIQKLLQTTTAKAHHELLSVAKDWLQSDNESTRVIGYKVTAELCRGLPALFASKIEQFLPLMTQQFGELSTTEFSENVVLALFETMTFLCQFVPTAFLKSFILTQKEHAILEKLNEFLQCVLSKPVQFAASGFLGQLLSTLKNEETIKFHNKLQKLFESSVGWSKLCYSLCFQLKGKSLSEATVEQLIKNLVFLSSQITDTEEYNSFCQRIANVCSAEVALYSTESLRRKGIFKLTAACALQNTVEELTKTLTQRMLPSLHREMLGKSSADREDLQNLASEVGEILKKQIGAKEYASILIECSKKANEKTAKRKEEAATLAVTDPRAAAQAKRRKHEKKAENRKRKLDQLKPYRIAKRKARTDIREKMDDAEANFFDDEQEVEE